MELAGDDVYRLAPYHHRGTMETLPLSSSLNSSHLSLSFLFAKPFLSPSLGFGEKLAVLSPSRLSLGLGTLGRQMKRREGGGEKSSIRINIFWRGGKKERFRDRGGVARASSPSRLESVGAGRDRRGTRVDVANAPSPSVNPRPAVSATPSPSPLRTLLPQVSKLGLLSVYETLLG